MKATFSFISIHLFSVRFLPQTLLVYVVQAAQRRKAADAGPMSVADIKKRKEAEQLRKEMANKKQRVAGASSTRPNGAGLQSTGSGIPVGGPAGKPSEPGRPSHTARTAQNGSAEQSSTGAELPSENAHTQTAAARSQQQDTNGASNTAPKRQGTTKQKVGPNGSDVLQRTSSKEPRATSVGATDKRVSTASTGAEGALSSVGAVRAGGELAGGLEQLQALAARKARKRWVPLCWEAEKALVEDAQQMLQKANANPGQCHPEVLKELNAIIKRVCCTPRWLCFSEIL
jgi:hypothetical protein